MKDPVGDIGETLGCEEEGGGGEYASLWNVLPSECHHIADLDVLHSSEELAERAPYTV